MARGGLRGKCVNLQQQIQSTMANSDNSGSQWSRITVKIGSNVLTRPDGTLDITRMSAIVDQVAQLRRMGVEVTMVSSGAMACGRGLMRGRCDERQLDAVAARQLYSAVGQAQLMRRYCDFFADHGIACGQVLTTKASLGTRAHYLNQKRCMEVMLEHGVIPIVNENDTISVTELMFTDNDELSGMVAAMMGAQALVILSNVDGVYDGNPADPASHVIATIDPRRRLADTSFIQQSKSSFGRGGMATKYGIARKVASEGIAVAIANGRRTDIVLHVARGDRSVPYTLFAPSARPVSSLKKWIAHSEGFAKGEIHINAGACQALLGTGRATSVLPVGVTAVEGDFKRDDIVRVIGPDGAVVAYGRVACDSAKARATAGQQGARPLIHYDYLYID